MANGSKRTESVIPAWAQWNKPQGSVQLRLSFQFWSNRKEAGDKIFPNWTAGRMEPWSWTTLHWWRYGRFQKGSVFTVFFVVVFQDLPNDADWWHYFTIAGTWEIQRPFKMWRRSRLRLDQCQIFPKSSQSLLCYGCWHNSAIDMGGSSNDSSIILPAPSASLCLWQ